MMNYIVELEIHEAKRIDVFRDIVRVSDNYRYVENDEKLEEGSIYKLEINGIGLYVVVRGSIDESEDDKPWIRIEKHLRTKYGDLKLKHPYKCKFRRAIFFEQILWAIRTSDISYRIPVILGLISLSLGIISIRNDVANMIMYATHLFWK